MISVTCQYALRALIKLAERGPGESALGAELAEAAGVPRNYLSKILHALKRVGIISTARGTGGGYWLTRKPEDIRLIEVVTVFDGPQSATGCLLESTGKDCSDESPCSAHAEWKAVRERYYHFLVGTSLAAITHKAAGKPPSNQAHVYA
ncbi:MAG: Rrf2 family transcriptional regulator [Acidobacteriota bacterium]|jgi:Rrf2 family transcriptional regulator, iron-sulfur cluster assembly transcription factor